MKSIEQLYNEWQSLQPLTDENQKRLNDKFMLEFNYNSNHIEGNTLTYGQTKMLLFFGETMGDAKMRDLEEMKAHSAGFKWIEMVAKESDYQLTEIDIRNLNHMIQAEDYYKTDKNGNRYKVHVGIYKTRPNSVITVTGEEFSYASPEETSAMMFELVRWFNEEVSKGELTPVELATLLHYRYIRIHPFEDGNGRIARLLINYVMLRYGYPMIIIKSAQKSDYLSALRKADINVGFAPSDGANATLGQIASFVEYMEQQLAWSLDVAIRAAKGENIDEEGDVDKKIAVLKQNLSNRAISKSHNAVLDCIEKAYYPFAIAVDAKITELRSMFDSFYITIERPRKIEKTQNTYTVIQNIGLPPEAPSYTKPKKYQSVNNAIYAQRRSISDYFTLDKLHFFFHLNHFRYNGENVFNVEFNITVNLNINEYEISSNFLTQSFIGKYGATIFNKELDPSINELLNYLIAFIDDKANE